ncbi:MAG: CBS domain-containing protein [Thermodesulfobacteria bacterium]|nr:CBS domain-containing protein [Thermodesulfobacteriota bacterium]
MLVKEWMAKDPIVIDENTSIMKATQMMKEHRIRRIPVVRDGKLIGIISDRDIKEAAPSKATSLDVHELYYLLSEIKVKDIMTPDPITLKENDSVEKAAVIMLENRISGIPIVDDNNHVIGVITQTDVFKVMISITGAYKSPIQIAFEMEDSPGSLNKLLNQIREEGGRIVSVLTSHENMPEGKREVYVRLMDMSDDELNKLVENLKKEFKVLFVIKEDLRNIPRKR